ncbi:hypothetical protein LXL04_000003 [Taraxacum kok-saghyz]
MANLPMDYNFSFMPIDHPFVAFAVKEFDFFQLPGQLMPGPNQRQQQAGIAPASISKKIPIIPLEQLRQQAVQTAKNGSILSIIPIMPSDAVFPGNPQQQPAKVHTRISWEIPRLPSVSLSSRRNSSSFPRLPKDEFPKLPLAVYADLDPHLSPAVKVHRKPYFSNVFRTFLPALLHPSCFETPKKPSNFIFYIPILLSFILNTMLISTKEPICHCVPLQDQQQNPQHKLAHGTPDHSQLPVKK